MSIAINSSINNFSLPVPEEAKLAENPKIVNSSIKEVEAPVIDTISAGTNYDNCPVHEGKAALSQAFLPTLNKTTTGNIGASSKTSNKGFTSTENAAAALLDLTKIDNLLTTKNYNATISSSKNSNSFYVAIQKQLTAYKSDIQASIDNLKEADPVKLSQYEQLLQTADSMATLYSHLAGCRSANIQARQDGVSSLLADISNVRHQLCALDPQLCGSSINEMNATLNDFAKIGLVFSTMEFGETTTASKQLGIFFLQTYQRLRSIEGKNTTFRKRASETADINGALNSFANDVKDMAVFNQRLAAIRRAVVNGGQQENMDLKATLLAAVPGTSAKFQQAVSAFADVYNEMATAGSEHQEAQKHLSAAQDACREANENLAAAGIAIQNNATNQMDAFSGLSQASLAEAKQAATLAGQFQIEATIHLNNFRMLKERGAAESTEALKHKEAAELCLQAATAYNNLIKAGPYNRSLRQETSAVSGAIATNQAELAAIETGAADLLNQFSSMDNYAGTLSKLNIILGKRLRALNTGLAMNEIQAETAKLSLESIKTATSRITDGIDNFLLANNGRCSYSMTMYLRDPEQFAKKYPEKMGEITNELETLMNDYPQLANLVAGQFATVKKDFALLKDKTLLQIQDSGADPNNPAIQSFLELLELQLVDGLLAQNRPLFQAMIGSSGQKSSQIDESMAWIYANRNNAADQLVKDPQLAATTVKNFNDWLATNNELNAKFQDKVTQYGQPVEQKCLSLMINANGAVKPLTISIFKDGQKFAAYNPLDGKIYSGRTSDEAMRDLARDCQMTNGRISYLDSAGQLQTADISLPADSKTADTAATITGVVGSVLMVIPEPITTGIGAGLIAASAAYSVSRGIAAISEQVDHETFALDNSETRDAIFNIISGLASGAGVTAKELQALELISSSSKVVSAINTTKNVVDIYSHIHELNNNLIALQANDMDTADPETWKNLVLATAHLVSIGYKGYKLIQTPTTLTSNGKISPMETPPHELISHPATSYQVEETIIDNHTYYIIGEELLNSTEEEIFSAK